MKMTLPALAVCTLMAAPAFSADHQGTDIDLSPWNITIPDSQVEFYGKGRANSAAELLPPQCNDSRQVLTENSKVVGTNNDVTYFEVIDGRAHFRADMGAGVTTENSKYIRSELRELFNVDTEKRNPCSTSNNDTSWFVNDSATNTSLHTLASTLRIDAHPDRAVTNEMPKVIVGQVHGYKIKQALVKLQWEGDDKPVRAIINQDFFLDNKSCNSELAKSTGCDKWSFSVNLGQYDKGEEWSYDITMDDQAIYLMTSKADGSEKVERTLEWGSTFEERSGREVTLSQNWTNADVAYYFKAGIYPQFRPNAKFAGEVFDVSFSEIELTHK